MKGNNMELHAYTPRSKINIDTLLQSLLFLYIISFMVLSYWSVETAVISHGLGLLLALVFLAPHLIRHQRGISLPVELCMALGFFMVAFFAVPFTLNLDGFLVRHFSLLQLIVFAIIAHNIMLRTGLTTAVSAVVCGSIIIIFHLMLAGGMNVGRISGLTTNANTLGMTLGFTMCLIIYGLAITSGFLRMLLITSIPVFGYFMMLTGSRKAMLIPIIVLLLFAVMSLIRGLKGSRRNLFVGLVCITIFAGVLVSLSYTDVMSKRMNNLVQMAIHQDVSVVKGERSLITRWDFYGAGLQILSDYPIFGVGTDQFRYAVLKYNPTLRETYSHSNYIEILANHGLVGFAIFYSIYIIILYKIIRTYRYPLLGSYALLRDLMLSLMLVIMVLEVGWVTYTDKLFWLLLVFIITGTKMLSGPKYRRPVIKEC